MHDVNKRHLAIFFMLASFVTAIFVINPIYGMAFNILSFSGFLFLLKENSRTITHIIILAVVSSSLTIGLGIMDLDSYAFIPYGLWLLLVAIEGNKLKDKAV